VVPFLLQELMTRTMNKQVTSFDLMLAFELRILPGFNGTGTRYNLYVPGKT
jgi:hypothetical protein